MQTQLQKSLKKVYGIHEDKVFFVAQRCYSLHVEGRWQTTERDLFKHVAHALHCIEGMNL